MRQYFFFFLEILVFDRNFNKILGDDDTKNYLKGAHDKD